MFQLLLVIIYLSFISLGLPDSLLGSAWPIMHKDLGVSLSYGGVISMIIAFGTIISSLSSDKLTRKFGTAKVTATSVFITAIALFGFSISNSFWMLCIIAIPYGLGAGSVDASLNNYVALNYSSRHMSWLHCMWGVGASVGPYIMGYALVNNQGWNMGYGYIAILQIILTLILFLSLPLWKKTNSSLEENRQDKPLTLLEIIKIPGAKEIMITFLCYCGLEQTMGLWASTYLVSHEGLSPQISASLASLYFIGITVGRALSGFLTIKFSDKNLVSLGQGTILVGVVMLVLPLQVEFTMIALVLIGLGSAPIYPCIIHSTPQNFGEDKSQAIIGVQMASAYVGTCILPALFGFLAENFGVLLLPIYLMVLVGLMFFMNEKSLRKCKYNQTNKENI